MRHLFLSALLACSFAQASDWTPIASSGDGQILYSTRNFKVVTPRDKFTFEFRTQYVPNTNEADHADVVMELSCAKQTAQVLSDEVTLTSGKVLTNILVDRVPFTPEKGSFAKYILFVTCPHEKKVRPNVSI